METFTNSIDQVIAPGDKVLVVTESTGRVETRIGKFVGWSEAGNLQVEVMPVYTSGEWYDERTGERCKHYRSQFIKYRHKQKQLMIVTLRLNRIYKLA